MIETIKQFLKVYRIDPQAGFVIAVSGGADSIALLHAFKYLNLKIHALHCNFNLRGKESQMDEQFVKRFCDTWGIVHSVKSFDTIAYARQHRISIEMAARDLRYAWFEETREKRGFDYIVLGHHADDLAETVLINLCRGTGIKGLLGIQPVNGRLLRPLLKHSRREIIDYITRHQLGYRTDSTNLSDDYVRNKIRHTIVPVCKEINPSFLRTIQDNCDHLGEVNRIYQYGIELLKQQVTSEENGETLIHIGKVMTTPAPYTLLYEILTPYGFNAARIRDILESHDAIPGKRFEAEEYLLTRGRDYWRLFKASKETPSPGLLPGPGEYAWEEIPFTVTRQAVDPEFIPPGDPFTGYFNAAKLVFPLRIRHWQTGDWFCPLGMKRSRKKLSDLFTDLKFTEKQKRECLILTSGEEIIWVAGHRLDDRYKITPATRQMVVIRIGKPPGKDETLKTRKE